MGLHFLSVEGGDRQQLCVELVLPPGFTQPLLSLAQEMTSQEQKIIKDLDKCDFREIHKHFVDKSEARKALSKEEKQVKTVSNDIWDWLICFGTSLGYFGYCLSAFLVLCPNLGLLWTNSVSMTITPLFIKFICRCCRFHGFAGYQSSLNHGLASCPQDSGPC